MLLLLPAALRTYGRSSAFHELHCSSLRRCAPTVGVPPFTSFTAPPCAAAHLRSEFRLSRASLLLPAPLRTYGRSSALHELHCSSLRRCAPTVGVPPCTSFIAPPCGAAHLRSEFRLARASLLLPAALPTYGRSSALHELHCSSLRRCPPTVGVPPC